MSTLYCYCVFHLNISFSSVEEDRRPQLVEKCYWPLLKLAADLDLPIGLEASGYTLEEIKRIDPSWIDELRRLIDDEKVELIGSGYSQLIGPLVPADISRANLRFGHEAYDRLLGMRPTTALVNEQAYSCGIVPIYLESGYDAIIMDYDNVASFHAEWPKTHRFAPQRAMGVDGSTIKLLWTNTIAFQKLQRLAHNELPLSDYLAYVSSQIGERDRCLALYGNDVEIFDFRPGRLATEAVLGEESEWSRLRQAIGELKKNSHIVFELPRDVLAREFDDTTAEPLQLETPEYPVPVKKQQKYNITRWAVTGRDDSRVNAACWRIYKKLKADRAATETDWRELCYLWSSDFRTHITPKRWSEFQNRLTRQTGAVSAGPALDQATDTPSDFVPIISEDERSVRVTTQGVRVEFNKRRGLAIENLWFGGDETHNRPPVCRTLPHGYFDDIRLGADWYSGLSVFEVPGEPKVTDLEKVEPEVDIDPNTGDVRLSAYIETRLGPIRKVITVSNSMRSIRFDTSFGWQIDRPACLRIGGITLNPEAFNEDELTYRTHNGGIEYEEFALKGRTVDHGAPISLQVSANCAVGMTEEWIDIGDQDQRVRISADHSKATVAGLVTHKPVGDTAFCRLSLTALEFDETRRPGQHTIFGPELSFTLSG